MVFPKSLPILAACLGLGACSMLPGISDGDPADAARAEAEAPSAADGFISRVSTPELTVSTDAPGNEFRQVDQFTRYARVNCNIASQRDAGLETIVRKLRDEAAAGNADYLRIVGAGPFYNRGICDESQLQLSGTAYRRDTGGTSGQVGGSAASAPATDSLAGRLEELEALRDRGLINQNEYEQLRERVLDEAY
ncbi:SHOCT domain-containing protein [Spiribacter roseus]|jgi:Cdc6-like AAA superfamily ATPase|uniref:SHOCT domain-containing protein n=1 Tax=Spiribacter roseus TaxID=1855875 RepID=UPI000D949BAC|nr:SHOCT domain-containing protein [Spiribacter roseus]AUB77906.1 hypothetical protein BBH56_01420 [Spiribacter roseus]KAF0281695.1 hypothetical protein BA900_03040 [Spiribacter roseus]KAF0283524.1 hypothetical protein BA898_03070 [Spiribacter roseus]PZA01180.1 hypothetical protein A6K26_002725 [Gammaproteobacteria bacterium 2W06]